MGRYQPAPVLRWREPGLEGLAPAFGVHSAGYDQRGRSQPVQPAVEFAPNSIFQDPFGDRLAQEESAPAPMPLTPPGPAPAAPPPDGVPPDVAPPSVAPPGPPPAEPSPMLEFGEPESPSNQRFLPERPEAGPPCDRIYNDRNCCRDEESCERVREFLRRMEITDISVDITPAFRPEPGAFYAADEAGPLDGDAELGDVEDTRIARLAQAGPRTWRNRQGEVIVEGRWTDYRYGRIYVSRGDGEVVPIPIYELSDDDLCFINAWWNLPSECTLGGDLYAGRHWAPTTFTWKASALCHKPLYFEELALERYGHTAGPVVQPVISGAHFFSSIFFLPYKMGLNPPSECIYPLGLYRPGSCAPWLAEPFPISLRGAAFQTGAVLGGVYLIP